MFVNNWLRDLNNDVLPRIRPRRRPSRPHGTSPGYCPRALAVEPLEDRSLLTALFVDTLADNPSAGAGDMDGLVSLREAVTAANTNTPFGDAPAGQDSGIIDSITFDGSLAGQTIVLGGEQLGISDDLSINGLGQNQLTVSGDNTSRVFSIKADISVDISDVTIANGSAYEGGGIYNEGELTLTNSLLTDNAGEDYGGAIVNSSGIVTLADTTLSRNSSYYQGGAIWSSGTLEITSSTFTENYSDYEGGAIWSDGLIEITDSTLADNESYSTGGGIYTIGTLEIHDSMVSGNTTGGNGAGIFTRDGGEVFVRETDFIENTSGSSGGAIDNTGGFVFNNPGSLDIADSTFIGNSASSGAGIWNEGPAIVANSTFSDNHVRNWGGAIANNLRTMTIANSTFTGNSAGAFSGAVDNSFGGTLHLASSLLSGNTAGREGGAIENYFGTMTIENSTITGNSSDGTGGGVWNLGALELTNSTIVFNRADAYGDGVGSGGGLYQETSSSYTDPLQNNTILAGNLVGAADADSPDDIFGLLAPTSAHNLIGDASTSGGLADGVNGNIIGNAGAGTLDVTTVLDANLADNGGPTLTHALVASSPAIDAGENSLAVDRDGNLLVYDQRGAGFARVIDGSVDIGAYEVQPQIIEIEIDVKPGSDSNPINLASQGVIAVMIPTTDDFDAALVDVSTVVFAGATAVQSALEDVDGDGDLDMVLHFQVQDTNLADAYAQLLTEDPDSNHQSVAVSLGGETINDEVFAALDDVDLFLAGRTLRELLEELAEAGAL